MDIRIHDRWRNVTIVPTKVLADPEDTMIVLMNSVHTAVKDGQAQLECDQEWMDALNAKAAREAIADPSLASVSDDGIDRPSFRGVPIKVTE